MFSKVNDGIRQARRDRLDKKFINEEAADEFVMVSDDALAPVDADTVPPEIIEELEKAADKIISSVEFDDMDIGEMLQTDGVDPAEDEIDPELDASLANIPAEEVAKMINEMAETFHQHL